MIPIKKIEVEIYTGGEEGAGTDGDVYLGICGREFYIDSKPNNFERGKLETFVLGDGANIIYSDYNDPRKYWTRYIEDLKKFPVYIRFDDAAGKYGAWFLEMVTVTVQPGPVVYEALKGEGINLWLGRRYGMICYLESVREYG